MTSVTRGSRPTKRKKNNAERKEACVDSGGADGALGDCHDSRTHERGNVATNQTFITRPALVSYMATIEDTETGATFESQVRAAQFAQDHHDMTLEEALENGVYTRDRDNDTTDGEWVEA